jgi:hypothetical protein
MISQYGWQVIDGSIVCDECSKELSDSPDNYYVLPNGIEAKDVSGHFMSNVGIAMNYLIRAGKKAGCSYESDLEKAINHLQFELERIRNVSKDI